MSGRKAQGGPMSYEREAKNVNICEGESRRGTDANTDSSPSKLFCPL